jgi:membrane protein DedA with SNARE-associated domain
VTLGAFLIAHGSALILPLAVIEGPIVTIVTGFLTAQGYFGWYWALPLLMIGDVIGDVGYYAIGRSGIARLGRIVGIRGALTPALRRDLTRNATKMLLIGKWTHTIGGLVLVGSGMLRMPLPRFILVNLLATIPKSAVLFGLGYFAGDHYPFLERHYALGLAALFVAGAASIALLLRRPDGIWAGR